MPEASEQVWRIEAGSTGNASTVYLNGELVQWLTGVTVEVNVGQRTTLTLRLVARNVEVIFSETPDLRAGNRAYKLVEVPMEASGNWDACDS